MRRRQVLLQAVALGELMDPVARLQHHAAEHAHHAAHRHHAAHVDQRRARRRIGRAAVALALRLVRSTGTMQGAEAATPRTGSCNRTVSRLQPYVLAVTLAAISVPRRSLSSATGRLPSLCLVMLEAYCASAWLRCCRKVTHSSCSSRLDWGQSWGWG